MISLVPGVGEASVSRLSLLGSATAAAAWILVVVALRFDRPDSFCDVTRSNAHVRDTLLVGAVVVAAAAVGSGFALLLSRRSAGASRRSAFAIVLVGAATLLAAPALFLVGHLALWQNC
jgi:hypothetical protein